MVVGLLLGISVSLADEAISVARRAAWNAAGDAVEIRLRVSNPSAEEPAYIDCGAGRYVALKERRVRPRLESVSNVDACEAWGGAPISVPPGGEVEVVWLFHPDADWVCRRFRADFAVVLAVGNTPTASRLRVDVPRTCFRT